MHTPFRLASPVRLALASIALFGAALGAQSPAQSGPLLQSGPMVGASQMREVALWVQTTRPALVQFAYWDSLVPARKYTTEAVRTAPATAHVAKVLAASRLHLAMPNAASVEEARLLIAGR